MKKSKEIEEKKKKDKKQNEPQYYMSPVNIPVLNYKVYYLTKKEKVMYFVLAFIVGAAVGYLFYGGIGKDDYGNPTTITYILNIVISTVVGVIAGKVFLPIRTEQILKKRKKDLNEQFKDMLNSLSTSLNAGKNVPESFASVYDDLSVQYEDGAFILDELKVIVTGIQNNIALEDLIADFGQRSDNDDIRSFAEIFQISYRKGGNVKEITKSTYDIIFQKSEVQGEIDTIIAGNQMEQYIMLVMPVILVALVKVSAPDMADNFTRSTGLASTTVGIVMFAISYWLSKELTDIEM